MFVFFHYIGNLYNRKVEEYEKMIKDRARSSYYSEAELRKMKPSPKDKIIKRTREIAIWTGTFLLAFTFIFYIVSNVEVCVTDSNNQSQECKDAANTSK